MAIEVVVLDCDGVILESVDVKTRAFGLLAADHGPEAATRLVEYHLARGGVSRFEKFRWFFQEVLKTEITPEEMDDLNRRFTMLCFTEVMKAPFVPGAWEFITDFSEKTDMYVASGTPDAELKTIFAARDLSRYFRGVHGAPPDKSTLLARIVRDTGVQPTQTLMVGDSSTDMEAARDVGTLFFGRGRAFAATRWPWAADLTRLGHYLREMNESSR